VYPRSPISLLLTQIYIKDDKILKKRTFSNVEIKSSSNISETRQDRTKVTIEDQ